MNNEYRIASFYRFMPLSGLEEIKSALDRAMEDQCVSGTIIIAEEGFNGTVSALEDNLETFLVQFEGILGVKPDPRFSGHDQPGFKRRKVKIKPEIVTLRKKVDMELGRGTHLDPKAWNEIIADPETTVIDARNDYEFNVGTFRGAINPVTESFSELPEFIESNVDPKKNPTIAMFCTGGIRCEKLAPFLIGKGYETVYQLDGGILRYLEEVKDKESLWEGECFVFDERVTVDKDLNKGSAADVSALKTSSQKKA